MVCYCCVKGCGNNSNNKKKDPNSVISFHAFPSNQDLKTKWLRAIGRPNWVPPKHSRVCSAHFRYDQINYDGCRIRVKEDAFPINCLPLNSNFEASDVEACRICLATDVKIYSLQDTHLGTCMDALTGCSQNHNIEGLPQYVCYQCAPCLIKCNKLIEQCLVSQETLLDIFAKNGQITKSLIKENRSQLNLKSPLENDSSFVNTYSFKCDDVNNSIHFTITKSDPNEISDINLKNEDEMNMDIDAQDFKDKICKVEISANEFTEINNDDMEGTRINSPVEEIIKDDLNKDSILNAVSTEKCYTQKRQARKKCNSLTPDETNMLKHFDILKLSLNEQIQEWEKSTVRRPLMSETVYQCEICKKAFANDNFYSVHVTYHDPSQGKAECPVCKLRFKNAVLATSHAKRAHSKKFFCKICPKAFNNVGVAKKHQRWHSGYLYKCDACPFSTLHESSLGVHKRRTHRNAHACVVCGHAYNSKRGLDKHVHNAHRMIKEPDLSTDYCCEECDINFVSEGARRVHILTSGQHRKKPDLCDSSAQEPSLRNSCNKCGTECASFKDLVLHMRAQHPRPQRSQQRRDTSYPISCEICSETISSRKKHWQHVRRQHPKNIDTYKPVITAVCDTCGKGFQNSTKLRLHQLRHRSPTVHCHRCSRLFYDKYALARHERTHNADKPHQCRTCGRAFKLQSNLERHSRVHMDIAPYECTMCGKKFKYSSSVNLHVRTVHYKLPHPPRKKRNKSMKDTN